MSNSNVSPLGFYLNPGKYLARRFKYVCSRYIYCTETILRDRRISTLRLPRCAETLGLIPKICDLAVHISELRDSATQSECRANAVDSRAAGFADLLIDYVISSQELMQRPEIMRLELPRVNEAFRLIPELSDLAQGVFFIPKPDPELQTLIFRRGLYENDTTVRLTANSRRLWCKF
jgi:hypothetical protein